jgi:tetratricopeptide (TPR) repeat protein
MDELLGYVFSWILDISIPPIRKVLGNWGCFLASVLVAGSLVWFLPAYVLRGDSDDWKAWLVVGPLATVALVVMITSTYDLMKGSRVKGDEQALITHPGDQEPGELSVMPESQRQNIEELLKGLQDRHGTISFKAEQAFDRAYAHQKRGEFEEALRECEAAIRFDPGYAAADNLVSIILEEMGRAREAMGPDSTPVPRERQQG